MKKKFINNIILVVGCFIIFLTYCGYPDSILLRNGNTIKGKIVTELKNGIVIQIDGERFVISNDQIRKIKKDTLQRNINLPKEDKSNTETLALYRSIINSEEVSSQIKKAALKNHQTLFIKSIKPAENALSQKRSLEAIGLFEQSLIQFNEPPFNEIIFAKLAEAYSQQGLEYIKSKEFGKATQAIRKALEYNPYSSNAHFVFGVLIIQKNDRYYIAKQEFQQALEYQPNNKIAKFYLKMLEDVKTPDRKIPSLELLPNVTEDSIKYEIAQAIDNIHKRETYFRTDDSFEQIYSPDKQEIALLLAGYNAGPTAVMTYKGNVPYPETREYIKRVFFYLNKPFQNPKYDELIENKALKYGLDPMLVKAIVKVESDYNHLDVTNNWAGGARGLIQLIKEDWDDTIERMNVNWKYEENVFDPEKNLEVGCHYLNWLLQYHIPNWAKNNFEFPS